MAAVVHLDTHVVAWLYAGRADLFSKRARGALESGELLVSPMVVLELEYLFEIKRVSKPASEVIDDLASRIGLAVSDLDFATVVASARSQTWTRDPFDRLIVGQAIAGAARLLTKDTTIRKHCSAAIW